MRIVCISDTHNQLDQIKVPDGDVLVHAGDGTNRGSHAEIAKWASDLATLPHRYKVVIAGNHDWMFQKDPERARLLLPPDVNYLQDSGVTIDGVKFWGSPWQPAFCDWAFNLPRESLAAKWALIPTDIDVLVTHTPPYGIMDQVGDGPHLGCAALRARVSDQLALNLHVFGHIHDSHGFAYEPKEYGTTTKFVNAASCTEGYRPWNEPIVVDV